ncbi:MAG TPA: hypothetical protein VFU18_07950 [Actinomycetota bacterium]|nr:hypothetical protein [Actinomycetota bacterium]
MLERSGKQHAAHVAGREAIRPLGEEINQSSEVGRLDPDPLGSVFA